MTNKSLEAHFIKCLKEGNTKKALYIIKLLGDKVNKLYDHRSLLFWASSHGNVKVVEALLDAGAKVDEKDNYDDDITALMKASENGHLEIVETLIENGAKVDEKNNDGSTPLMYASGYGTVEVVKALIENGAKVDEKNDRGCTPLMWASYNGRVEVVKMLLSMGAIKTINEKDIFRETALMKASEKGHVKVVKTLIENGAKVDEKDNNGKTAIDFTSNDEIKKMLKEALRKQKVQKFKNKISGFFGR